LVTLRGGPLVPVSLGFLEEAPIILFSSSLGFKFNITEKESLKIKIRLIRE
jgi:hypothetical protein